MANAMQRYTVYTSGPSAITAITVQSDKPPVYGDYVIDIGQAKFWKAHVVAVVPEDQLIATTSHGVPK